VSEAQDAQPEPGAPGSERQSTPFLVLQFFVFPMAIVAVCVGVFVVFGLISAEGKTPRGYLQEIRSGGGLFNVKRWQAAFALANSLESRKDLGRQDPLLVAEVVALFEDSKADDPLIRRYLALALGRLGDTRAVPSLRKVLEEATPESDSQTVIYAAWALGALGDAAAIPELARAAGSEDPGVRKAAVHALGALDAPEATAPLRAALSDAADDVRWNAALALGRRGDPSASGVLLEMLDRGRLARVVVKSSDGRSEPLSAEQVEAALLQAVATASRIPDPELRSAVESLKQDPSLKVREAARLALGG
jgi:HEAT repeat protein